MANQANPQTSTNSTDLQTKPNDDSLESVLNLCLSRIEALEIKASYQEATIHELSNQIYVLQGERNRLDKQLERFKQRLLELQEQLDPQAGGTAPAQQRPPHY